MIEASIISLQFLQQCWWGVIWDLIAHPFMFWLQFAFIFSAAFFFLITEYKKIGCYCVLFEEKRINCNCEANVMPRLLTPTRTEATLETDFSQTCASSAGASVVEKVARQFSNQEIKVESLVNLSSAMSLEKIMNPILNPHTWNYCDVLFFSALAYVKLGCFSLRIKQRLQDSDLKM